MYDLVFFGALAGIVVLLAVAALSNRFFRGKKTFEVSGDYDERQQAARGVAYRNAFWTVVGYLALFQLLDIWNPPLYVLSFVGLFLALSVFLVSCILMDAYIGLSENPKSGSSPPRSRWSSAWRVLPPFTLTSMNCQSLLSW